VIAPDTLLASTPRLLELHAAEMPQKDELCGAFWGCLALRLGGADVDQDEVARVAGTVLSTVPRDSDRPLASPPRRDYRLELPTTEDPDRAGTLPEGVARAIAELSGGRLSAVPVRGPWSAELLDGVLDLAVQLGPEACAIANVATRHLWGSRPAPAQVAAYLGDGTDAGPPADWDVGHFLGLLGRVRGAGHLVLVADTYPVLGFSGVHVQPLPRLVRGLQRDAGERGGVLLSCAAADEPRARERLEGLGAELELWDNGSLDAAVAP
jgi:hypothetical protein